MTPILVVHIRRVRILNFTLTLDNFSFAVCFYKHAIFQYIYLREPVFGQFYHMNSFRHSRQVYMVHSGLQNEGPQLIIFKITDCMLFNLLMGTWLSMQRQKGGSMKGEPNVIMSSQQVKALQALHHIPPLNLHQASSIAVKNKMFSTCYVLLHFLQDFKKISETFFKL